MERTNENLEMNSPVEFAGFRGEEFVRDTIAENTCNSAGFEGFAGFVCDTTAEIACESAGFVGYIITKIACKYARLTSDIIWKVSL